jgi:hypothetical protein
MAHTSQHEPCHSILRKQTNATIKLFSIVLHRHNIDKTASNRSHEARQKNFLRTSSPITATNLPVSSILFNLQLDSQDDDDDDNHDYHNDTNK